VRGIPALSFGLLGSSRSDWRGEGPMVKGSSERMRPVFILLPCINK